ncbi:MAG: ribose 5-phosphate isomerase B [Armatimonadota bacterium]
MKVAIGSDHAGFVLKEELIRHLREQGYTLQDFGVHDSEKADYPDIALAVSEAVTRNDAERGILVCGSGIGMSIAANKVQGIRAALCQDSYCARMSRLHNDANVLVLGGRVLGADIALETADVWLSTAFSGEERHVQRVGKITDIEKKYTGG